jgi:hypothetical protein
MGNGNINVDILTSEMRNMAIKMDAKIKASAGPRGYRASSFSFCGDETLFTVFSSSAGEDCSTSDRDVDSRTSDSVAMVQFSPLMEKMWY